MATVEREIQLLPADEVVAGGVPLATLRLSPADLEERRGLEWGAGSDDLGDFFGCVFETSSHGRFALLSYDSEEREVTLIGALAQMDTLDDVLRSLRVAPGEVLDRIDRPQLSAGVEFVDAELRADIGRELEQFSALMRAEYERLRSELEVTRLASLASLEAERLTARQREVLELLTSGLSPQQVADELAVRPDTVTRHIKALRSALVHSS